MISFPPYVSLFLIRDYVSVCVSFVFLSAQLMHSDGFRKQGGACYDQIGGKDIVEGQCRHKRKQQKDYRKYNIEDSAEGKGTCMRDPEIFQP